MLVIDGSHTLHRCCHQPAYWDMVNSSGVRTGPLHGFYQILHSLSRKFRDHGMVVCWDLGCSTYRTELYKDYKAHSGSRNDPDFRPEIDIRSLDTFDQTYFFSRNKLHNELLPLTHVISLQVHGVEADDIISWIVGNVKTEKKKIIVTSDRDMYQLLGKADFYNPIQDSYLTKKEIIEEYDLIPEQWRDHLLLMKSMIGDSSDNIQGIEGVGEKRASKIARTILEDGGWEEVEKSHLKAWQNAASQREKIADNMALVDLTRLPKDYVGKIAKHVALVAGLSPGPDDEELLHKRLYKLELTKARTFANDIIAVNIKSGVRKILREAIRKQK